MKKSDWNKIQNVHLTYKGHYILNIPYAFSHLMYCYEGPDTGSAVDHTHVVLKLSKPRSKVKIIRELALELEVPCQIQVDSHKNLGTAIGYHIGLGDKPRCPNLVVVEPVDFNVDEYIKRKVAHRQTNINEHAALNRILLQQTAIRSVDEGVISLFKLQQLRLSQASYVNLKEEENFQQREPYNEGELIDNPWNLIIPYRLGLKRRHFWISGPPNIGKTHLFVTPISGTRRAVLLKWGLDDNGFIYNGTQLVFLDRISPGDRPRPSWLEDLTDGVLRLRVKYEGTKLVGQVLVIILSNYTMEQCYTELGSTTVIDMLHARFAEYTLPQ